MTSPPPEFDAAAPSGISENTPRALSSVQERRLTDYMDEHILQIQREYKKRNYEGSSLSTLSAYLKAVQPLLSLVLMIPPVNQSVTLRTALLLRLTGEILECAPGYPPDDLPGLLDVLDELDKGWLAVLRSQVWDPESHQGKDLMIPAGMEYKSTLISQTDRTRLRSLLILATDKLEEWLEGKPDEVGEVADALEALGIRQRFDDIFHLTLSEMGELQGSA